MTGLPILNEQQSFTVAGVKRATWADDLSGMKVVEKYLAYK